MRITAVTCDGCGQDITDDMRTMWEANGGARWASADEEAGDEPDHVKIEACSAACVVRILADVCDACSAIIAAGAMQKHTDWHNEGEAHE